MLRHGRTRAALFLLAGCLLLASWQTRAAADEPPQQVVLRRIVASGELRVSGQFRLHALEALLAHDGRNARHEERVVHRRMNAAI